MKNQPISQGSSQSVLGFTFLSCASLGGQFVSNSDVKQPGSAEHPHDDQLTLSLTISTDQIENLPGKVYENCQRTARVIILSQLQKMVSKDKKRKILLGKILSQYMPNKGQTQSSSEYSNKKGYYDSLHYSRVRIGQRQFLKNILLNSQFKETFEILFQKKAFETSEKARKNQRSQISFQQRRNIILNIIQQYKKKFCNNFKVCYKQSDMQMTKQNEQKFNKKQPKVEYKEVELKDNEFETRTHFDDKILIPLIVFPLIPIPLLPSEYQSWQKSRREIQ